MYFQNDGFPLRINKWSLAQSLTILGVFPFMERLRKWLSERMSKLPK